VEVNELAYEGVAAAEEFDGGDEGGAARGESRVGRFEDEGDGSSPSVDEGGKVGQPCLVGVETGGDIVGGGSRGGSEEVP
jgi:hypothetical protein